MDPGIYNAVKSGDENSFRDLIRTSDPSLLPQSTAQKDTILHVAAKFRRTEIAKMIIARKPSGPSLMYQKNAKDDTPLHIAARLGCSDMVDQFLLCRESSGTDQEVEANEKLVRMVNKKNDTALHEAVRFNHLEVVESLVWKDTELVNLTNDAGESPLFLAVDRKHLKIANFILHAAPNCSFQGRHKMNALLAAVIRSSNDYTQLIQFLTWTRRSALPLPYFSVTVSFKYVLEIFYKWRWLSRAYIGLHLGLIEELIKLRPSAILEQDDHGWTPFHFAAYLGDHRIVKALLSAGGPAIAYSENKEGISASHIAAKHGRVPVLEQLVESCPDIFDLQDSKGKTALHFAAEDGQIKAVKFILGYVSDEIINQKDNDGNTPLLLAALQQNRNIFDFLVNDTRVDMLAINNKGLAAVDIIQSFDKYNFGLLGKRMMTARFSTRGGLASLERHAREVKAHTFRDDSVDTEVVEQPQEAAGRESEPPPKDNKTRDQKQKLAGAKEPTRSFKHLTELANNNLVVATLVATVSFAAAFTVPGGFKNDEPHEGTAILIRKASFRVFLIANAMAFFLATSSMSPSMSQHFIVPQTLDALQALLKRVRNRTSYSTVAMEVAFVSGSYAALINDSTWLAGAIIAIALLLSTYRLFWFVW